MVSDKAISVDDKLINIIRKHRNLKGYTQKEIATILGISSKKYSRFESGKMLKIQRSLLKQISNLLEIDLNEYTNEYAIRCSFSLSQDMKRDLEYLQMSKGFDNLSDTIRYCIEQVVDDFHLQKVSVKLQDDIREVLSNTYVREINKLSRQNEIMRVILNQVQELEVVDVKSMQQDLEQKIGNIIKADK